MSSTSYRDFSNSAAENYERYFVPAIATPVSGPLLAAAALEPGERVLDVACGTGVVARLAAPEVGTTGSVAGVDVAPDMIEVAAAIPVPKGTDIEWHTSDATALPFPDDSYDVALCQMGLMFVENRASAVAEMKRVLVPEGRLVVSTPGSIQPGLEIMAQAISDHIDPGLGGFVRAVFSMHDPDAVASLLREAQLSRVTTTVESVRLELPPPADFLWQYVNLTPMGPVVAQAPDSAKTALERDVVAGWQPYLEDGAAVADQPMVIATARKAP